MKKGFLKKAFPPEMYGFWSFIILGAGAGFISFKFLPLVWFVVVAACFAGGCVIALYYALVIGDKNLELSFEKERLERMVTNLDDAVLSYDSDFRIVIWNAAAEKLFKLRKEDVVGQIISPERISDQSFKLLVQTIFPSLAPSVVKKSAPGVYPQLMEIAFIDTDLELSVSMDRIVDDSGKPLGFLKIIHNRTREVGLLRSKSEFVTVAAHQLRTPLTAVHWIFETLSKNDSVAVPDKELVDNGLVASLKLLKIVNDMLDVSKIEAGKFGYNFIDLDMASFIDDLLQNANVLAREFNVTLYFDKPKNPIMVHADPQKLGMALSNIVDNAIKYNVKNGQVVVKLELYPNKPYIQLTVKDTGVGIPPEGLKKLFTKFYRGENVVKEQTEGTGLGLYITKNIILRHGGSISADSVMGRGTTFYIVLPTDATLIPPKEVSVEEY
ncbi:MAG: ATP-binding protein [Candidatus Colwellbacteria bacterium]|nr:ATP-binding protein [Candidatus Colwellbacteria bacterium]